MVKLYGRFDVYIKEDVIEKNDLPPADILVTLLLAPMFKWEKEVYESQRGVELMRILERSIDLVSAQLRTAFDQDLLHVENALFFTYLVVSSITKIGIHPTSGTYFVKIFRRARPSIWNTTRSDVRIQYASLILAFVMQFYELDKAFETKSGFSLGVLSEIRSVFSDAANSDIEANFAPHQWVFRWLVDKLDVDVLSNSKRLPLSGLSALSPVEQNLMVELTRRFSAYRIPVSIQALAAFLLQFETTQRIRGAIRLLSHVKFYPLWALSEGIEKILVAELREKPEEQLVLSAFGEHTGSAAIMNYLLSHSPLSSQLRFEQSLPDALSTTRAGDRIYIIDDCLLSGTQTLNTLGDLMGTRAHKQHYTVHAQQLSEENKTRIKDRDLRFTFGVAMDEGIKRFKSHEYSKTGLDSSRAEILYGTLEVANTKIFDPLGPVTWVNQEERDDLHIFCKDVGYKILGRRAKEKSWDDSRRKESALGFSDMQRLLVFPYNVPKTTLTLLWERSRGDFEWNPLFPGFD
ncbi:phosphoribosyltransferase-like protein [Herbaspirillum sp. B65]|uniref:phosphoribosyltransferase-like protein n=1 Tax=Herbaspirillum sp. B65 TaxID=137708 RepID=UPI00034810F8